MNRLLETASLVGVMALLGGGVGCATTRGEVGGPGMEPTSMYSPSRGAETRTPRSRARAASALPAPEALDRSDLDLVLGRGIAAFLQAVGVEEDLRNGRFVGFRITSIDAERAWPTSVDLRVGDTVTSINGMPIERPEQAFRIWEEMRVASELRVDYLRGSERRVLRFAVRE